MRIIFGDEGWGPFVLLCGIVQYASVRGGVGLGEHDQPSLSNEKAAMAWVWQFVRTEWFGTWWALWSGSALGTLYQSQVIAITDKHHFFFFSQWLFTQWRHIYGTELSVFSVLPSKNCLFQNTVLLWFPPGILTFLPTHFSWGSE